MAKDLSAVSCSMPKLIGTMSLRVRFSGVAGLRLKISAAVVRIASLIGGFGVEFEPMQEDLEFTDEGCPRALSILPGHKCYRHDALDFGGDLTIMLDGVEQQDVVAYDIDAGRVSRYSRGEDRSLQIERLGDDGFAGLVVEHLRGAVTVGRNRP